MFYNRDEEPSFLNDTFYSYISSKGGTDIRQVSSKTRESAS